MIGITTKSVYGLSIVIELAEKYNKKLVTIDEISRNKKIPRGYMIQLLNELKSSKIIESFRGIKGGYRLARHPDKITLIELLNKLEGGFELFKLYGNKDFIRTIFNLSEKNLKENLNITVADILDGQSSLDNNLMYFI